MESTAKLTKFHFGRKSMETLPTVDNLMLPMVHNVENKIADLDEKYEQI